jgi:REP element-mobilizing transposase RayT
MIKERAGASPAPTNAIMVLNEFGQIAHDEWKKLPQRFSNMEMDVFQIMPNHMHAIIALNNRVFSNNSSNISKIVGSYKSLVANECLKIYKSRNEIMGKFWQRNYFEHVIFSETALYYITEYIINNPMNWNTDDLNRDFSF